MSDSTKRCAQCGESGGQFCRELDTDRGSLFGEMAFECLDCHLAANHPASARIDNSVLMQSLTAKRMGDTHSGYPTFDVYSDEIGRIGNYTAVDANDAITQAREDLT